MYVPLTKLQYQNAIKSGFSPEEIIIMEKKRKQLAESKPGYFSAVGQDYKKIAEEITTGIKESAKQVEKGGVLNVAGGLARGALRTVGGVAEAAFTPITEAPIIKPALELAGKAITKIPGAETVINKLNDLAQKHPQIAKDVKNIIDISVLGGGKTVEKPIGIALEKSGKAIEKSGLEAANIAKEKFALDLIKPIETKTVKLSQVPRTTETSGLLKTNIVTPTKMEADIAKVISKVPEITEKNTFQRNFNLIQTFNIQKAKQLETDIAKYDFLVPRKETLAKLNEAAKELENSPLVVGDAAKTAQRLVEGAKKIINENSGNGSGLLKARKEYDSWVLSQKPKVFDATSENAFTTANDTIRQTLNTMLDEKAINLGVKDSLKEQSLLYRAMDNIAPKAAEEANTQIGRIMQRVGKTLGTKNKIVQAVAAAVGIGGLGAAATFAPAAAVTIGTGYVIYKTGRIILKPQVKIAIGKLLQTSGKLLNAEDKIILEKVLKDFSE